MVVVVVVGGGWVGVGGGGVINTIIGTCFFVQTVERRID